MGQQCSHRHLLAYLTPLWWSVEHSITATPEATILTPALYIQELYIFIMISMVGSAVIPTPPWDTDRPNSEVSSSSGDDRELGFGVII